MLGWCGGSFPRSTLARGTLLVVALLTAFGLTASPSLAACAAPETSIDVRRAQPGDIVDVSGEYWGTECNDTGSCTSGCYGEERCTDLEPGRYQIVGVSATAIGPGTLTEPFRVG